MDGREIDDRLRQLSTRHLFVQGDLADLAAIVRGQQVRIDELERRLAGMERRADYADEVRRDVEERA